jgi:murein DD-endopeptidase MepM/ murein hydrolase activator NlpD
MNPRPGSKIYLIGAGLGLATLILAGCAGVAPSRPGMRPMAMPGIYHRIEKDQTLWRISKNYNIDLDELVRINHISDATNIEIGQLIFIPHAKKIQTAILKSYSDDFIWPLKGKVISTFGQNFNNMINKGLNIHAYGGLDVLASRSGKVVFYSPNLEGFGKTVIIEHGEGFSTVYARNSRVLVRPGEEVRQGTIIAKVGSGGRDKDNYLHFEIRKGYASVNPYFYLP